MKALRSTVGWFLMGLAGLVLCVWAVAHFVTGKVESGHIASPIVDSVLHQEDVQEAITEQAQTLFANALEGGGLVPSAQQSEEINAAIASAVASEEFIDDVVEIAEEAEADVIAQLTDDSLPLAPLSISIDITDPLYTIIGAIPELEAFVPSIPLDPIELENVDTDDDGIADEPIVDADTVENIRNGYGWVETISTWALWLGLVLVALGVLAIPGKRWIVPKILLGVGLSTLFLWLIASRLEIASLMDVFFEEEDSGVRDLVNDVIPQSRVDGVQSTLWKASAILLLLATAGYALVWYVFRKREAAQRGDIPEGEEGAPTSGGVLAIFRKRWTLPKTLLKLGVTAVLLWFLASLVNVEELFIKPEESGAHDFINDLVPQSRVDGFQSFMWIASIVFLVLAVAGFVLVWYLSRTAEAESSESPPEDDTDAGGIGDGEEAAPEDDAEKTGAEEETSPGSTTGGVGGAQAKKGVQTTRGAQAKKGAKTEE